MVEQVPMPRRWFPIRAGLTALLVALAAPVPAGNDPAPAAAPAKGPVTGLKLPRWVSLKIEAKLRRGPGTDHRVDWLLKRPGTPLLLIAEYDVWRKVVDADGTAGWVHHTRLRGTRTVVILAPQATLRAEPQAESRPVALAEQGVIARVESCNALWCEISAEGRAGWIAKADIWGVGTDELID
jgi:SH3-like domain-containing protein